MSITVKSLREIADHLGARVHGDDQLKISGIKSIEEAGPSELALVVNPRYLKKKGNTRAGAIIQSDWGQPLHDNAILVANPYAAWAKLLAVFYPAEPLAAFDRRLAFIDPTATVAPDAIIFPGVYIGRRVKVERGVVIYASVFVGDDTVIGEDTVIHPGVALYQKSVIGKRVIIHAGAIIGGDGFGFADPGVNNLKVPHVGYAQLDDDVEIGANTTIDRGTMGRTWIQRGTKIDNLVMIAHNVIIGENSIIVAQVGLAGSTTLGRGVVIGGQAAAVGHITLGDGVMVAARAGVHKDVPSGQIVAGSPHLPHREWLRKEAHLGRIPEMKEKISRLEDRIKALEESLKGGSEV